MTQQSKPQEGAAKWFAQVNDINIPCSGRLISAGLLRHLSGIAEGLTLYRDFDSPDSDPAVASTDSLDLGDGNVFYAREGCVVRHAQVCTGTAKLAFAVDDRMKVTTRPDHTGAQLKEMFSIDLAVELLRDRETPHDEIIADGSVLRFDEGPVFITRHARCDEKVMISINGIDYPIVPGVFTVDAIKAVSRPPIPAADTLSQVKDNKVIPLSSSASVKLKGGEIFVSNQPTGGAS